jgi:hypothetical protein
MAKIRKKNTRIVIVSFNKGRADITATISTLRPLILEIVFKGLSTLNTLKPDTLKDVVVSSGPGWSTLLVSSVPASRAMVR